MDYIYDIVLNFQDKYYDFYEWKKEDKITNVKKIPIYKISSKDYLNIKYHTVTIDKNSLPKYSKIFLLTNGMEIIGILIDTSGKVLKKSSLIFEEADDILDSIKIKSINLKYNIDKINKITYMSRVDTEKTDYINKYFKKIDKIKDEYLIKYLYYDIFNEEEKDTETAYQKLLELSKNNIAKLYESITKINN